MNASSDSARASAFHLRSCPMVVVRSGLLGALQNDPAPWVGIDRDLVGQVQQFVVDGVIKEPR